jgi:hypothetical protein
VELFNEKRSLLLNVVTKHFYPDGRLLVEEQAACEVRCELYRELPLLAVPFRAPGQVGERPMLLLPNVPCLSDAELEAHLKPVLALKRLRSSTRSSRTPHSR